MCSDENTDTLIGIFLPIAHCVQICKQFLGTVTDGQITVVFNVAGCRNIEGNRLAGFVPQLCEIAHGQFRAGFAFRRAIAVDAVGVGLAHGHEPLFETIDC